MIIVKNDLKFIFLIILKELLLIEENIYFIKVKKEKKFILLNQENLKLMFFVLVKI